MEHFVHQNVTDAQDALQKLIDGNAAYVKNNKYTPNVSAEKRKSLVGGQNPFAVVVGCSDSRAVPEVIFGTDLGDLFVVRVAGNVVDRCALGSIQYAAQHLQCKLVVVLGHTHCGAVHAALCDEACGYTQCITNKICQAIGDERDEMLACIANVHNSVEEIRGALLPDCDVTVVGALYSVENGKVYFL